MTFTVACLFVRGEYPYTVEFVSRLRDMVRRWSDRRCRFVCLTDQPERLPDGVEAVVVEKLAGFAYWTKLELFNPARQWTGRVLYLDLDTLIAAPLAPILDYPAPFAITADREGGPARDRHGRQIVRRFNSSVMVWDGGTHTDLYTDWTPCVSARLSGDQDWIGEHAPHVAGMPLAWFPRLSQVGAPPWPEAKIVLTKHPKNDIAVTRFPWFAPLWGAA